MRMERRRSPRMKVSGLAYVNLDPDNGGVILDISEGGLCFQSTAPVKRTETIRFWFSYRGLRVEHSQGLSPEGERQLRGVSRLIEVRSELAWTDETLKRGGLRFTNLSDAARTQIRDWIRQPALVHVNGGGAGLFPSVRQSSTLVARVAAARFEAFFRRVQSSRLWNRFFGGVMTGILVSLFLVGAFSQLTHSHILGDSLIELGQRLGGRSWSSISPAPQAGSLELEPTTLAQMTSESNTPSLSSDPDLEPSTLLASKPRPPQELLSTAPPAAFQSAAKLRPSNPPTPSLSSPKVAASADPAVAFMADKPQVPGIGFTAAPDFGATVSRISPPEMASAGRPALRIEPSAVNSTQIHSEKYLEIGKFKEKPLADQATQRLSQLGFPATVIQRSRLFVKSYQVLVGPFASDPAAEAAHKDLSSRGFTPRSYERGKRDFYMPASLQVGATRLPAGLCVISWESYSPDAIVRFDNSKDADVTVQGKWLKESAKYAQDAVGYQKNRDGSRTLIEIRFSGMAQTLVFGSASK
jgi:PilZ domain/SPOR domain